MSDFIRFKPRTAAYAQWEAVNNNTPGGLKIMQGELCIVLADAASAAAGLSNIQPDTSTPRSLRMANAGEVLGHKVGDGAATRWDQLPWYFPFAAVSYPNGSGRVLGTRNNGGTHVYNTPQAVNKAIFGPVYTAPGVGISLTSAGNDINGLLVEVGQVLPSVLVNVAPQLHTYRIKLGQAFEATNGKAQLGADETANDPDTIGNFSRAVASFSLTPANASYDGGSGSYGRSFVADVVDARPSAEGGENRVENGPVGARAVYPLFFGKSATALPADPAQLGAFLQANTTPQLLYRGNYSPGKISYSNGQHPILAIPEAWGPLSRILDELGLNQLGYSGAAFNDSVAAKVSKNGQYANVPYRVYTTSGGYNSSILFDFLF